LVFARFSHMRIFHLGEPTHGWIDITFGREANVYTMTVSDVPNDCLRDLATAVSLLLRGSTSESVEFSLEPGFATCELRREADEVQIVVSHPDHLAPVFTDSFPLRPFANRVRFEMLKIRHRYAVDDGWTQVFPEREIANLT